MATHYKDLTESLTEASHKLTIDIKTQLRNYQTCPENLSKILKVIYGKV